MSTTKYKQGTFIPRNKDKYKGHFPIRYRSSWEAKLMQWCDANPAVQFWGSESAIVEYVDPSRQNTKHNYIIDFSIVIREKDGHLQKYYVEVKPLKETTMPVRGKKREGTYIVECLTYLRNEAKWKAALEFAKSKGAKFIIITEVDLFNKKV